MPNLFEHWLGAAKFMQTYIDELDLDKWPNTYPDNLPNTGRAQPRPGEKSSYANPAELWARTDYIYHFTLLPSP